MSTTPYVVGQWVRGEKFYGRDDLIDEVLRGNRNCLWILGTRRIGKTSLLKQVEYLASRSPELGYFTLFWDFQGAEDPQDLHEGFSESLWDATERLEEQGIDLDKVEADDLFRSMTRLRHELRPRKLKLLLLCDEVEELVNLNRKEPRFLRRLRRGMQSSEDIRTVMASKIKLWELADEKADTDPFLLGFTPPLYIHSLADEEARALIRQVHLPDGDRPRINDETMEVIRAHCNNHPYLIQLLCERFLDIDSLERAIEEIASDSMVSHFFAVDFEMLTEAERNIIRIIGDRRSSTSKSIQARLSMDPASLGGSLHSLEHLGYLRRDAEDRLVLANYFFKRWFNELPSGDRVHDGGGKSEPRTWMAEVPAGELGVIGDRYELLELLGEGASGAVFKAFDKLLDSIIAVKILRPEYAADDRALGWLRREVTLSRDLAHPNIIKIYHLGDFEGKKYLTMRYMEGPTLADVISNDAPFPDTRTVAIAAKLADALEAAHDCRVVHRDIKPHNVLMGPDDEPFITDFGLARLWDDPSQTAIFVGTPDYASPEQASTRPLDARSDLYALGVVIFEMATGRRPFVGKSSPEVLTMHQTAPPPAPLDLRPGIAPDLSRLILKCLEKDPARRFQSAKELRDALQGIG